MLGKPNAVIFGIGKRWRINQEVIESEYNVIGYIDNFNTGDGISSVEAIKDIEYDVVIVMPSQNKEMVGQLKSLGVPEEKIVIFDKFGNFNARNINSYSQHYEDLILVAIFSQLGIQTPTYIDLGAHHPFRNSNTATFYERGSRGINIEPNPVLFEYFEEYRKDDINLNVGVSTKEGVLPFYSFGDQYGINTFSKEEALWREKVSGLKIQKVINLPVVTL